MTRPPALVLFAALPLLIAGDAVAGHASFTCAECHISHRTGGGGPGSGSGALWSTRHTADGLPTFTLYSSPSFDALGTDIGQPDGPSKLCLGCHDGSYSGFVTGGKATFSAADLALSHPISFTYDSALAARVPNRTLNDPATTLSGLGGTIADDLLDANGKMQCTSCHDVHSNGRGPNLLRYDYRSSNPGLCRVCHNL